VAAVSSRIIVIIMSTRLELVKLAEVVLVPLIIYIAGITDVGATLPVANSLPPTPNLNSTAGFPPALSVAATLHPLHTVALLALGERLKLRVGAAAKPGAWDPSDAHGAPSGVGEARSGLNAAVVGDTSQLVLFFVILVWLRLGINGGGGRVATVARVDALVASEGKYTGHGSSSTRE
jgi:hypothetical protein